MQFLGSSKNFMTGKAGTSPGSAFGTFEVVLTSLNGIVADAQWDDNGSLRYFVPIVLTNVLHESEAFRQGLRPGDTVVAMWQHGEPVDLTATAVLFSSSLFVPEATNAMLLSNSPCTLQIQRSSSGQFAMADHACSASTPTGSYATSLVNSEARRTSVPDEVCVDSSRSSTPVAWAVSSSHEVPPASAGTCDAGAILAMRSVAVSKAGETLVQQVQHVCARERLPRAVELQAKAMALRFLAAKPRLGSQARPSMTLAAACVAAACHASGLHVALGGQGFRSKRRLADARARLCAALELASPPRRPAAPHARAGGAGERSAPAHLSGSAPHLSCRAPPPLQAPWPGSPQGGPPASLAAMLPPSMRPLELWPEKASTAAPLAGTCLTPATTYHEASSVRDAPRNARAMADSEAEESSDDETMHGNWHHGAAFDASELDEYTRGIEESESISAQLWEEGEAFASEVFSAMAWEEAAAETASSREVREHLEADDGGSLGGVGFVGASEAVAAPTLDAEMLLEEYNDIGEEAGNAEEEEEDCGEAAVEVEVEATAGAAAAEEETEPEALPGVASKAAMDAHLVAARPGLPEGFSMNDNQYQRLTKFWEMVRLAVAAREAAVEVAHRPEDNCVLGFKVLRVKEVAAFNRRVRAMTNEDTSGVWKKANGTQTLKQPTGPVYESLRKIGVGPEGARLGQGARGEEDRFWREQWAYKPAALTVETVSRMHRGYELGHTSSAARKKSKARGGAL